MKCNILTCYHTKKNIQSTLFPYTLIIRKGKLNEITSYESLNESEFVSLYSYQTKLTVWHEQRRSFWSGDVATWRPVSSRRCSVWLSAALNLQMWSSWKALWTRHPQQHIFSQSKLDKGRKGERRRWRVILMNLWQFFFSPFILLSAACLILIKPIPQSCLSFIELAGDIFSTHWPWERKFRSEASSLGLSFVLFFCMKEK